MGARRQVSGRRVSAEGEEGARGRVSAEGGGDGDQRGFIITDTGISPFQSIYGTAGYASRRQSHTKENKAGDSFLRNEGGTNEGRRRGCGVWLGETLGV